MWDQWLLGYSSQTSKIKVRIPWHAMQGPADLALTSMASSPDTRPFQQFCTAHISQNTLCFSCPTAFLLALPSVWSALLPPFSAWKKCIYLSRLSAATTISVHSSLTFPTEKMNHWLLIVLCTPCDDRAAWTTACLSAAPECDVSVQDLVSLHEILAQDSALRGAQWVFSKWMIVQKGFKKQFQCDRKVSKILFLSKWP